MDLNSITEASLEALAYKATDARNNVIDTATVDAFCGIVKNMPEYTYLASKLIAGRIQSSDEWEALQGFSLLESCMEKCGQNFHSEVGKFRFLNEIIKLVSPKYLGPRTSPKVRDIAITLLHSWTVVYSKEPKIKEAYEMLKKQGIVTEYVPKTSEFNAPTASKSSITVDHEFENRLKKLLTSKNPDDLEAANRMIKSRVIETDRRSTELERVRTNIRLLSDMVANCTPGAIPTEDLQLMGEIHTECERLRPVVFRLAGETQESDTLTDILNLTEELELVFEKYAVAVGKNRTQKKGVPTSPSTLLDFSSPVNKIDTVTKIEHVRPMEDLLGGSPPAINSTGTTSSMGALSLMPSLNNPISTGNDLDHLGAIFAGLNANTANSTSTTIPNRHPPPPVKKTNKQKALDELDVLGESVLQQCKNDIQHSKASENLLAANDEEMMDFTGPTSLDEVMLGLDEAPLASENLASSNGLTDEIPPKETNLTETAIAEPVIQVKPLTDVLVQLEKISPSDVPPLSVLDSVNGVSIKVHLARDTPREDVSVYVITTTSTSNLPLTDYLFQVVVPKKCKFKLQPPSATSLPAHNPFLPPSAITQILLIANPCSLKLHLTFMLSFTREDETVTEVGEVTELPTLRK